jgi:hypothetical protein
MEELADIMVEELLEFDASVLDTVVEGLGTLL